MWRAILRDGEMLIESLREAVGQRGYRHGESRERTVVRKRKTMSEKLERHNNQVLRCHQNGDPRPQRVRKVLRSTDAERLPSRKD